MKRDFSVTEENRLMEIARKANDNENWFDNTFIDAIERWGIESNIASLFMGAKDLQALAIDAYNLSADAIKRIFEDARNADNSRGAEFAKDFNEPVDAALKELREINEMICIDGSHNFYYRVANFQKHHPSENITVKLVTDHCPDFAKETFGPNDYGEYWEYYRAADGSVGHVCSWNDYEGGELSCTFYTLRKLRERGLGFPFAHAGGASGGQWFENSATEFKRGGQNGIEELLDAYGGGSSLENVVVSFSNPSPYGHVLLIDRVYRDENGVLRVEYSDMYDSDASDPRIHTLDGYNQTKNTTLDEFKNAYRSANGNIIGAVLVGA